MYIRVIIRLTLKIKAQEFVKYLRKCTNGNSRILDIQGYIENIPSLCSRRASQTNFSQSGGPIFF